MNERHFFDGLLLVMLALSVVTFLALFLITAPYGRHNRGGWGPTVRSTVGWVLMEAPASLVFAVVAFMGEHAFARVPLVLLVVWQLHYFNRSFIYPFRRRGGDKPMPLAVVALGFSFNCVNGYLNARWLTHFHAFGDAWLTSAPFLGGVALFLAGYVINQHSDHVLRTLRAPGESGYKIPTGGLYRLVSAPNYLGEILEWCGWTLAAWSPAGAAFVVWTIANLVPRAWSNHKWYKDTFADYPRSRKAIVPFIL